jgi:AraC-like DNA-binding protein
MNIPQYGPPVPRAARSGSVATFGHAGRFSGRGTVRFHSHSGLELILVTSGSCSIESAGRVLRRGPGHLFVISASAPHNQVNHGHARTSYVSCHVDRRVFDDTWRTVDVGVGSMVASWMEHICDLSASPESPPQQICDGLVQAIVYRLRQMEHRTAIAGHPALRRAVNEMEQDLGGNHTVASLAAGAFVSGGYLIALFRAEYGVGPIHYLQRRRMKLAQRLLEDPYLTVRQVGQQCGYDDPNYFARAFRKVAGVSPTAYRMQCEGRWNAA